MARATIRVRTTGLPCACSSSTSSPVNEFGAAEKTLRPLSMISPAASRKVEKWKMRGCGSRPANARAIARGFFPETLTTPTPPPRTGGRGHGSDGAVAAAHESGGRAFAGGVAARDDPLLQQAQTAVDRVIK